MFFLAIRQLLSRRRQTLLMVTGIMLGTAAFVAISGMMIGFQQFIINQLVNNDSHVRISAREELVTAHSLDEEFFPDQHVRWLAPPSGRRDNAHIEYPAGWFERLNGSTDVLAYSPQMVAQVIAKRAKVSQAVRLIGSDPTRQIQVSNIENYMLQGHFKDIGQSGNRVILGDGLLNKLGARISENVLIASANGSVIPFKVVGVFHLGIKSLDDSTAFGALADVQKVNQTPSQVSDIAIRLHDVEQAGAIATQWASISRDQVQSWDQANEGTMSVFKTQNIVRNSMTISILVVAGFGIYNILTMAISQKRREIAILRSIGFEQSDIVWLFLVQGLILGALGGLVGSGVGYVVCRIMETIEVSPQRIIGSGRMMVAFDGVIYVRAFLLAFASASIASVLPARAAGKMTPIDIIRAEGT